MAYFNDTIDVFGEGDKMLNTCLIRLRVIAVETDERGVGELRCHTKNALFFYFFCNPFRIVIIFCFSFLAFFLPFLLKKRPFLLHISEKSSNFAAESCKGS